MIDEQSSPGDDNKHADHTPLARPLKKGYTLASWAVIALLVAGIVTLHLLSKQGDDESETSSDRLVFRIMEVQGKYLIGAAQLPGAGSGMLYEQAADLDTGPVRNRLGFVTLAGELVGPEEALEQLDQLDERITKATAERDGAKNGARNEPNNNDPDGVDSDEPAWTRPALRDILRRLYQDYEQQQWGAPSLNAADRQLLHSDLGWFGGLALAPAEAADEESRAAIIGPAKRTTIVIILIVLTGLGAAAAGFMGFTVLLGFSLTGRLQGGIHAGAPHGGVYAETFVCWMLLYMGLSFGIAISPWAEQRMLLAVFAMLISTAALAWPVLRGIPWRQVRQDVGLVTGRSGWLEPLWGVVCYLSTIPLLLLGMTIMFLLLVALGAAGSGMTDDLRPTDLPSHPIVDSLADANVWTWAQLLVLACVAAPILEETMFRGVLYRNLRDWSAGWRIGASVLFAAALNSFVFAAVHPQGLAAIPPLMALAMGFSLAREWRGSLIAPMVAHGLNNGLVMCAMLVLL